MTWTVKQAEHALGGTWGIKDERGWVAIMHPGNGDEAGRARARERAEGIVEALAACEAALKYIPGSEVRSWPPGFRLKDDAISKLTAALTRAGAK